METKEKVVKTPAEYTDWTPEMFGWVCIRKMPHLEGTIWAKRNFRLQYVGNMIWLCTKKRKKGNTVEIVVNFSKEIRPEDVVFAEYLIDTRL